MNRSRISSFTQKEIYRRAPAPRWPNAEREAAWLLYGFVGAIVMLAGLAMAGIIVSISMIGTIMS